jgi:phosphotransacetylase
MGQQPDSPAIGRVDQSSGADPRAAVLERWHARASELGAHIVLADNDERAQEAARLLEARGLARVTILRDVDPHLTPEIQGLAMQLGDGVDIADPLHIAALMVRSGQADAAVAGATRPTPDVIRAGHLPRDLYFRDSYKWGDYHAN